MLDCCGSTCCAGIPVLTFFVVAWFWLGAGTQPTLCALAGGPVGGFSMHRLARDGDYEVVHAPGGAPLLSVRADAAGTGLQMKAHAASGLPPTSFVLQLQGCAAAPASEHSKRSATAALIVATSAPPAGRV